jgi:acetyltransferase-like isoleucine patch superfamily enzyme
MAAFLRGMTYAAYFRVFRKNVHIQLPFLVFARVSIQGPGSVYISRHCAVHWNVFDGLNITTLSPESVVTIGKNCNLGGVTIRCHNKIEMEEEVLLANSLIQDVPYFSKLATGSYIKPKENNPSEEIHIGKHTWLSGYTIVLGESNIGKQSVVSLGSVCHRYEVPENYVAFGNPVYGCMSISQIERLRRTL